MGSIGVTMNVGLDGVVQGLGRPDEDTRGGDATRTVAELKAGADGDLSVIDSAAFVRHLHVAGLVDHYTLVIDPRRRRPHVRRTGAAHAVRAHPRGADHVRRDRRPLRPGAVSTSLHGEEPPTSPP